MRRISFLLVGLIIVGLIGWLTLSSSEKSMEKLTLAEASQSVFALVYIAQSEGYFKDQGLDITYKSFNSGKDALNSALSGAADIATTYETPVVLETIDGLQISVITELHNSSQNTALVARKDHGINSAKDLKGKKIGVTKRTNAEFFLGLFLVSHGLSLKDVKLINTKPTDMAASLKAGTVDAVATWNPNLLNAFRALPRENVLLFSSDVYTEVSVLAGKRDVIKSKSSALKKLLQALLQASFFLENNPDRALEIVIARLSAQPENILRETWSASRKRIGLSNSLLTVLEDQASWLKEQGQYNGPVPDFRAILYTNYLKTVSPERVTILD